MSNTQSNDLLRELNAKLLVKIAELRKKFAEIKVKNDKLKNKNAEIVAFSDKITELEAKRTELKIRIANLLRHTMEENKMHDAENAKLKARIKKLEYKNVEFRDRIMKVKQRQLQNNNVTKVTNFSINSSSNFNSVTEQLPMKVHSEKSLKKKKENEFLDSKHREMVSKKIIQNIKEKKLRDQELSTISLSQSKNNSASEELYSEKVRPKVPLEQNSKSVLIQKDIFNLMKLKAFSAFTDGNIIEVIDENLILTTNTTIEVELAYLFLKKIDVDKIKNIKTFSADSISKFTQSQIQIFLDYFSESEKVRPKVPLEQNSIVNSVSNTKSTNIISRANMIKKTSLIAQTKTDSKNSTETSTLPEKEILIKNESDIDALILLLQQKFKMT
ncbi:9049_t:CDS:2 [Cetraspora pellucida]|uniref:9049_t:CDS:1 n=1 Tax=Cetraspora pellucida TaxID=1433469 RepID=A0ACA9K7P6_9GLOM|nr:9049_t:CDS:2 [Cetraspora pellucida]